MSWCALLGTLLFAGLTCACAAAGGTPDLKPYWDTGAGQPFRKALRAGIGFSFAYDGKQVGPEAPAGWQFAEQVRDGWQESVFRHPSGLAASRRVRSLPDCGAVEYTVRFRNEGAGELPVLADVNAIDLTFEGDLVSGVSLVSAGGGGADAAFPPKDFAVSRTQLGPTDPFKSEVTLTSASGLPSKVNLPFFFIDDKAGAAGVYVGIGWTGDWRVSVRARYADRTLLLQGGMPGIRVKLRPGEEISGPSILIGGYRGPLADGSNALRRAIREHYAPPVAGKKMLAPCLYTTWFDIGAELDEKLARTLVDRAAEIGQEIFLVDAGWYEGTPRCAYTDMRSTWAAISNSLGNWERGEERSRFPGGLAPLADYARSKGMQFGLWFEPERVGPESLLAKEHPDWVTFIPNRRWGLADFGRPEVQEYFIGILDRYVRELGLRYIRWDHNVEIPSSYWAQRDTPDRQGMAQIRHLEGMHRVEDEVRRRHLELMLESCAGGGQRIDLETLRRRHTIWISDNSMDPQIVRFHLEGLNVFVPGSAQGIAFAPRPNTYRTPGVVFPEMAYQVCFAGAFGTAGRLQEWPQGMREQARRHVDAYKKIRRFASEDYYLLVPQARTLDGWAGWQFHDPKTQEGFVQAFRLSAPDQTRKLPLHGLDPKRRYRFTDVYTGAAFEASGAGLLGDGLEFDLPPMSSRVLAYGPVVEGAAYGGPDRPQAAVAVR